MNETKEIKMKEEMAYYGAEKLPFSTLLGHVIGTKNKRVLMEMEVMNFSSLGKMV